jgi:oligosaccharide repeat unit polymerase
MYQIDIGRLPLEYWLCAILLMLAFVFAVRLRYLLWVPPFLAVLGTVAAWYMIEPIYFDDFVSNFPLSAASLAYGCLLVFLITFIVGAPIAVRFFQPVIRPTSGNVFSISPEHLVPRVVILWLCLLGFGIYRMDGDVLGALFPIEGRAGGSMWGRSAAEGAGASGFLVSSAAYLYMLVLSLFGLLLPITKKGTVRWLLILCVAISWPYALMQGSRHVTLAVITPAIVAYLLLGQKRPVVKTLVAIGAFIVVDFVMRTIIEFRDVGFGFATIREIEESRHLGLNMASELIYIASFIDGGSMDISYGSGYLNEILNVVPRAIWANKPLLGIDYAVARGFGGGESDIGVFATLSSGVVGQGVLNFGIWLGPVVAGCLMAIWVGLLTRLRYQGGAARTGLFLVGLGLTFNLGRDITLLVLYPFVFGYVGVVILEAREKRKRAQGRLVNRGLLASSSKEFAIRSATQIDR